MSVDPEDSEAQEGDDGMITMFQLDKEDVRTLIAHAYECSKEQVEISIDTKTVGYGQMEHEEAELCVIVRKEGLIPTWD